MHAYSSSQGLCRFQNTLRPSNQCQCSTSFAPRQTPGLNHFARAVHSSSTGSNSSRPGSDSAGSRAGSSPQQRSQLPSTAPQPTGYRRRQPQSGQSWDYKYKWQPCPSPCQQGDERCRMVEALIQNVLSYPIMHPWVCKHLPRITADINSITALVEQMASHFGKELTLLYVTKHPNILQLSFNVVLDRISSFRELFGVLESDIPMMLRKNPGLLTLKPQELRQRYDNLRELTRFNNQQMRAFVLKCPLVFNFNPAGVRAYIERLQQLSFTRDEWTRNYQLEMTPSFMAFFLRDAADQLLRLEYLASTGERPEWRLRDVMKPADATFRAKTKNFTLWEKRVKARRAQQREAHLQQQQATETADIKAALLADEEPVGPPQQGLWPDAGQVEQQQQQQQPQQQPYMQQAAGQQQQWQQQPQMGRQQQQQHEQQSQLGRQPWQQQPASPPQQ